MVLLGIGFLPCVRLTLKALALEQLPATIYQSSGSAFFLSTPVHRPCQLSFLPSVRRAYHRSATFLVIAIPRFDWASFDWLRHRAD